MTVEICLYHDGINICIIYNIYIYYKYIREMSTTMFETERWQLIDHYLLMIQNLNAQTRVMHTAQNEAYEKILDLIQSIRTPEIPRWNHSTPHLVNESTYRSTRRMNTTPMPLRRRAHEPPNTRQGVSNTPPRTPSRGTRARQSRSQTEINPSTSSPNVTGEQDVRVDEGHHSRIPRTNASSEIRTPLNMMPNVSLPTEIESVFPNIHFSGDNNNSSPFANIINNGVQLPQQQMLGHMTTPFNFFNNVPVFPTPEEISNATRIISFDNIEEPINDQCPITMSPFNPSDIVTQIVHCGHIFDVVHLNGWFRTNVRCPVCRHDIRDIAVSGVGVNDDSLSTLVPENFVDDGTETDPDMPPLEPLEPLEPTEASEAEQHTTSVPNVPASSEPLNPHNMNVPPTLHGTIGSINIEPIWGFRQSSETSPPQFISDIQNAITAQGIDLLATAITQSIQGSFPPRTTPVPEPNPDNEDNETRP